MQLITTYQPLDISFTRGSGCWLFDNNQQPYLDTFAGIAVCGLGHSHPIITKVISEQITKLMHVSNGFIIPEQLALAERLCALSGMQQVFFANSGCEANEAALKLARLYARKLNIAQPVVITLEKSFHGRTIATLSASGSEKLHHGFEPLVPGFMHVPINDIDSIFNIQHHANVVAVMIEPIQGEGGVNIADLEYLQAVAKVCQANSWLLIIDEVQSGNGRTGAWYAYQHAGIKPDVVTTAKGLGNGYPIGVSLMANKACNLFQPGNHGSTFGGNPLAMVIGKKVLDLIEENDLITRAEVSGNYLLQLLKEKLTKFNIVKEVRGKGLMIGIELLEDAKPIKKIGLTHGILLNVTAEKVIRLLPPLIITDHEIEILVEKLQKTLTDFIKIVAKAKND